MSEIQLIVTGDNAAEVFDFALAWAEKKGWTRQTYDHVVRIVIGVEPPVTVIPAPQTKTYPKGTNQDIINLFYRAAGKTVWQDWIKRAGLDVDAMHAHALVGYSGPAVEDMSGLTQAERDALLHAIMVT